ncbi:MAG TPA: restriction endonuclease subunit S [Spirochaetota bacterium]|nr:restriction endonuclease subunit S [Spirochaetota bacterium]HPV42199.1 restriction endonuclease subunit S [Spirochaetota bacterium]
MKTDIQFYTSSESINLPNGWHWVKLGDVCDRIDYGYTASADFSIDDVKFLRITDIQNNHVNWDSVPGCKITSDEESANQLMDGDIVFARTGGTTGKSYLIQKPPRSVFASYLIRLSPSIQTVPQFLYSFFQSDFYWRQIKKAARGGAQPNVNASLLSKLILPLPPLPEQKRITAILNEQMDAVEKARTAAEAQLEASIKLQYAYVQDTLKEPLKSYSIDECTTEVSTGIGSTWSEYPVLGATRSGLAPAKEPVGSRPERYKFADAGTIFYNPMRILIGSIALVDDGDSAGITSPDYVVIKAKDGILHYRWFYHWLRSPHGERFIKSLARGAVRERILYKRLIQGSIDLPSYESQVMAADKIAKIKPLVRGIEEQLKYINVLPTAILRKAFSGGF